MRWLDRRNRLHFVDIASPDFTSPDRDHSYEVLMSEIHGRLDGEWIKGVEVFRVAYEFVGLGWAVIFTRLPGISAVMDWGYGIFARNRVRWFGRCTDDCSVTKPDKTDLTGNPHAVASQP